MTQRRNSLWLFRLLLRHSLKCYTATLCHPTAPSNHLLTVACPEVLEKCQRHMCKSVTHTQSKPGGHGKLSISKFWKLSIQSSFLFQEQAKSEFKTILPEKLTLICQKYKHLHSQKWRKLQKLCNNFLNTEITDSLQVFGCVLNLCNQLWSFVSPAYLMTKQTLLHAKSFPTSVFFLPQSQSSNDNLRPLKCWDVRDSDSSELPR